MNIEKGLRAGLFGLCFLGLQGSAISAPHRFSGFGDHSIHADPSASQRQLVLHSNGFNVQKPSGFIINGIEERVTRGLTIIHFNLPDKYEFRTFDTHASGEDAKKFMESLGLLQESHATYAILAHDSASKSLVPYLGTLKKMGFGVLSGLAGRQAYVMHNLTGKIEEQLDDMSLSIEVSIPRTISQPKLIFPRVTWDFEPNIDRYIAHGGGEVRGIKSTNSLEALNESYARGFRMFELDIIETSDGAYVASHDWAMWSRFTDYGGELPVSLADFSNSKIYGKYTPLNMARINSWFLAHPDATLITDKVNEPVKFAEAFVDKSRLIMELFSFMAMDEACANNIRAMISQEPLEAIAGSKLAYLKANGIGYVAVSRRIIAGKIRFFEELRDQGIKVYVYNVGFDPGKDEHYVQDNEIGLVYGMYADTWAFDPQGDTN